VDLDDELPSVGERLAIVEAQVDNLRNVGLS
jgi:hypothetical protein